MAWVNKKYECEECQTLYDEWDDAKECCPLPSDLSWD